MLYYVISKNAKEIEMQTLTINIHNNALVEKVVWLLEHFKHDGVEIISQDDIDDLVQLKKTRDEQSIPFEIDTTETKEEVLGSFRTAMKDIASGEAIKNARPVEELFEELAND